MSPVWHRASHAGKSRLDAGVSPGRNLATHMNIGNHSSSLTNFSKCIGMEHESLQPSLKMWSCQGKTDEAYSAQLRVNPFENKISFVIQTAHTV